jgi:putative spermidine/putrescine transport system permease protein
VRAEARALAYGGLVAAIYAFLLAPLVVVVAVSFDPTDAFRFPPPGLSLRWYAAFFTREAFVRAFFRVSLVVALGVSGLATLLGGLAAIGLVRFAFRGRTAVETAFLSPIVVPEILLGAGLYLFYTRIRLQATLTALVLGHLLIAIPYVVRTVSAGLAGVSLSLEEAAMSLGATRAQAFWKVTLPLIRSSLLSGAIFAFIISFSDINLALFITGPETVTLPVHIFSEIVWQSDPTIAAASTLQIALIAILLGIVQRVFRLRVALS